MFCIIILLSGIVCEKPNVNEDLYVPADYEVDPPEETKGTPLAPNEVQLMEELVYLSKKIEEQKKTLDDKRGTDSDSALELKLRIALSENVRLFQKRSRKLFKRDLRTTPTPTPLETTTEFIITTTKSLRDMLWKDDKGIWTRTAVVCVSVLTILMLAICILKVNSTVLKSRRADLIQNQPLLENQCILNPDLPIFKTPFEKLNYQLGVFKKTTVQGIEFDSVVGNCTFMEGNLIIPEHIIDHFSIKGFLRIGYPDDLINISLKGMKKLMIDIVAVPCPQEVVARYQLVEPRIVSLKNGEQVQCTSYAHINEPIGNYKTMAEVDFLTMGALKFAGNTVQGFSGAGYVRETPVEKKFLLYGIHARRQTREYNAGVSADYIKCMLKGREEDTEDWLRLLDAKGFEMEIQETGDPEYIMIHVRGEYHMIERDQYREHVEHRETLLRRGRDAEETVGDGDFQEMEESQFGRNVGKKTKDRRAELYGYNDDYYDDDFECLKDYGVTPDDVRYMSEPQIKDLLKKISEKRTLLQNRLLEMRERTDREVEKLEQLKRDVEPKPKGFVPRDEDQILVDRLRKELKELNTCHNRTMFEFADDLKQSRLTNQANMDDYASNVKKLANKLVEEREASSLAVITLRREMEAVQQKSEVDLRKLRMEVAEQKNLKDLLLTDANLRKKRLNEDRIIQEDEQAENAKQLVRRRDAARASLDEEIEDKKNAIDLAKEPMEDGKENYVQELGRWKRENEVQLEKNKMLSQQVIELLDESKSKQAPLKSMVNETEEDTKQVKLLANEEPETEEKFVLTKKLTFQNSESGAKKDGECIDDGFTKVQPKGAELRKAVDSVPLAFEAFQTGKGVAKMVLSKDYLTKLHKALPNKIDGALAVLVKKIEELNPISPEQKYQLETLLKLAKEPVLLAEAGKAWKKGRNTLGFLGKPKGG